MHGATTDHSLPAEGPPSSALNRSASDLEERVACVGRSPNNFFGQQRADLRANSAGNDQPTQLICEARGILRGYTSLLHVDRSILLIV